MPYDPASIEAKWQAWWRENEVFRSELDPAKPKFYVLDMFPYPSGAGLHVGHPKGYIATDIVSRYKRMRGFNVLHPMGWDAFGLPAEQYAIETGTHPRETTARNIATFKRQLQSLGLDYDWSREIDTTDPGYVKWTQWIFRRLYEMGLAYLAEVPVNWCPALGTVLANEEVIDGKSERGGHPVVRVPMRQWMLRITAYADRLIEDLDLVDWPESIKKMQRDWVGRSVGARIEFEVEGSAHRIEVFTTRPDTLFGATYLVLAPEHPLVAELTAPDQRAAVTAYVEQAARRSERSRIAGATEKSGVAIGAHARHPVTGARIPIWIADYVLASYGTGAIMAVPGHDARDWEFARAFDLPIVEVVKGGDVTAAAYEGDGTNINSGFLDGLPTEAAKERMCAWLAEHGRGERAVSYKLRDWLFSRQRYWGEPLPVLHFADGSTKLLPESELPLLLPELDDFAPSGEFETPLARSAEWIATRDPETGEPARRDANTMPQWAGSCWYYLRFCDPHNDAAPFSREAERYWMPVDLYVGGAEHAVLHLLYARFWHKVLYDLGLVHTVEPFQKLLNPGMVLGYSYRYYDDDPSDQRARRRDLPGVGGRARWRDAAPRGDRRRAQGALAAGERGALGRRTALSPDRRRAARDRDREDVEEPRQRGESRRGGRALRHRRDAALRDVHGADREGRPVVGRGDPGPAPLPAALASPACTRARDGARARSRAGPRHRRPGAPARGDDRGRHRRRRAHALQHRDLEADGLHARHRARRAAAARGGRCLRAAAVSVRAAPGRGALAPPRPHHARSRSRRGPRPTPPGWSGPRSGSPSR